jgi:cellulose biosynthesis protein BcsQ
MTQKFHMTLKISVRNDKGGVGKTVTSNALASAFSAAGKRVQLVDLDPQAGAMLWAEIARRNGREPSFDVSTVAQPENYDVVIYDHQPGLPQQSTVPGDLVVVPTTLDVLALAPTMRWAQELTRQGKPFIIVPNRVEVSSASQSALLATRFAGTPFIRKRVAFQRLYDNGMSLYDDATGVPLVGAARADFNPVVSAVLALAKKIKQAA